MSDNKNVPLSKSKRINYIRKSKPLDEEKEKDEAAVSDYESETEIPGDVRNTDLFKFLVGKDQCCFKYRAYNAITCDDIGVTCMEELVEVWHADMIGTVTDSINANIISTVRLKNRLRAVAGPPKQSPEYVANNNQQNNNQNILDVFKQMQSTNAEKIQYDNSTPFPVSFKGSNYMTLPFILAIDRFFMNEELSIPLVKFKKIYNSFHWIYKQQFDASNKPKSVQGIKDWLIQSYEPPLDRQLLIDGFSNIKQHKGQNPYETYKQIRTRSNQVNAAIDILNAILKLISISNNYVMKIVRFNMHQK